MYYGLMLTCVIAFSIRYAFILFFEKFPSHFFDCLTMYTIGVIFEAACEPYLVKDILNFQYKTASFSVAIATLLKILVLFLLESFKVFPTLINFGIC
jgi:hypothetical protein